MVQKVLSSKEYGKLTDTYAYNAQDMLTGYVGYGGYEQAFTYGSDDPLEVEEAIEEQISF